MTTGAKPRQPAQVSQRRGRLNLARVACNHCRNRKSKCSGGRPACTRCLAHGIVCEYATSHDNETRVQALRRENGDLRLEIESLRHHVSMMPPADPAHPDSTDLLRPTGDFERSGRALLHALANRTFEESFPLLCSLRNGIQWDTILEGLTSGEFLSEDPNDDVTYVDQPLSRRSNCVESFEPVDAAWSTFPKGPPSYSTTTKNILPLHPPMDSSPWLAPLFDRQSFLQGVGVQSVIVDPAGGPAAIQPAQQTCISSPTAPLAPPRDPFWDIFQELRAQPQGPAGMELACGKHVFAAALDDENVYRRAPKLSQLVARLVKSMKPFESTTTITMYALMWCYWSVFRWLLAPSQSALDEIPDILRPNCWRVNCARLFMNDFVLSPSLRDYLCQIQTTDMRWCTAAWTTIACHWDDSSLAPLSRDVRTDELDLSSHLKSRAAQSAYWSLGPSVRQHLTRIDEFSRVRSQDVL